MQLAVQRKAFFFFKRSIICQDSWEKGDKSNTRVYNLVACMIRVVFNKHGSQKICLTQQFIIT